MLAKEKILETIGSEKGSYVLLCKLDSEKNIRVGKLGCFDFLPGFYAYVGSALGPGGLAARIGHHLKRSENPHWHLDYFRKHAALRQIWVYYGKKTQEHLFAHVFSSSKNLAIPIGGFGSSDCSCISHFFYFLKSPGFQCFVKEIKKPKTKIIKLKRFCLNEPFIPT